MIRRFRRSQPADSAAKIRLSPRRLEPRRLLDGSAPGLLLSALDGSTDFVQASDSWPAASEAEIQGAEEPQGGLLPNSPPTNVRIFPVGPIDENQLADVFVSFTDVGQFGAHTAEIDWGDGSAPETINISPGVRIFGASHQYLDDDPTATSADVYQISVTVTDRDGLSGDDVAPVTVNNVAPSNIQIQPLGPVDENGVAQLEFTFEDPGTLDTHTVEVDWGDASAPETFQLSAGVRFFASTHQYLDDDPTATSSDVKQVSVRVIDDDVDPVALVIGIGHHVVDIAGLFKLGDLV